MQARDRTCLHVVNSDVGGQRVKSYSPDSYYTLVGKSRSNGVWCLQILFHPWLSSFYFHFSGLGDILWLFSLPPIPDQTFLSSSLPTQPWAAVLKGDEIWVVFTNSCFFSPSQEWPLHTLLSLSTAADELRIQLMDASKCILIHGGWR